MPRRWVPADIDPDQAAVALSGQDFYLGRAAQELPKQSTTEGLMRTRAAEADLVWQPCADLL